MHKKKMRKTSSPDTQYLLFPSALTLLLLFILLGSLLSPPNSSPHSQLLTQLAWQGAQPILVQTLNQHYLEHGMTLQARILTDPLTSDTQSDESSLMVLSAQSQNSTSTQPLTDTERVQRRLYWEQVALQYPQYREAWIQLYFLHLGRAPVETYLQQIITLDPLLALTLPR